jgi:5-methylcytosine-specific restriction endonuclease McrA
VDRRILWERHEGRCGICQEPVPFEDFHIDHIKSIFEGGEHSYANTQPSHGDCNKRKALIDRRAAAKRTTGRDVGPMPVADQPPNR